jgi:hypothetical protein
MKKYLPLFFLVCFFNLHSQTKDAVWLAPANKPKTFGLQNSKGEITAEAKFDFIEEADGNGWIVKSGGKYGVINSSGAWLIHPDFEIILQYQNGRAIAGKKQKVISLQDLRRAEMDGMVSGKDSTIYYGAVDGSGVWVVEPKYVFLRFCDDGSLQYSDANQQIGFLNSDGSTMIRAKYYYASRMNNGVAVIGEVSTDNQPGFDYGSKKATAYFVIDHSGTKLNETAYEQIREFSDGRAAFNKGGMWKGNRYGSTMKLAGGSWGFLDEKGKEAIAASYDYVYDFKNGKAKVRKGQKISWIDKDGNETTPPSASPDEKAFKIYCSPGFFGYIDLKGNYVIQPQFFVANDFSEGLAAVLPLRAADNDCDKPVAVDENDDNIISRRSYSRVLSRLLNVDADNGIYYDQHEYEKMLMDSIRMADSLSRIAMLSHRLYGYIDASGNMVLPAIYEVALPFHNGRAYVLYRGKWGVINKKGEWIFAPVLEWPDQLAEIRTDYGNDGMQFYSYNYFEGQNFSLSKNASSDENSPVYVFNEGIGAIYKYNHFGFIDSTGKIIASPVYDEVRPFMNGMAAVRHGNYWGYIDKTGKEVIPLRFNFAMSFTPEGLALASSGLKTGIDNEEANAMEYENDELEYFGYLDKKGNWAIKPQFTEAKNFSEGLAAASINYGNSGYIDKTGKFILPPKYNYAGNFENGFASVRINRFDPVYIDKTGKVSKVYTQEKPPQDKSVPLRPVRGENIYFGFVNDKGEVVIPYQFSEAGNFVRVK